MGVSERKAKEKENLRALILQAAMRLFVEKGLESTTIRNIAETIDYSVGTVYVYFKDKSAILHALHSEGFLELGGAMRILFEVSDPMERLHAMGRIYLRFALENPAMYDLMFNQKEPIEFVQAINAETWNEGAVTFSLLRSTVQDCIAAGHFSGHELEPLAVLIWSTVHGMCSLYHSQRIKGVGLHTDSTMLLDKAYLEFLKLIEKE
jgi:AcrR family transcriptional regulator